MPKPKKKKKKKRERERTPFVVSSSFYFNGETLQLEKGVDTIMTMTPYVHARTCR